MEDYLETCGKDFSLLCYVGDGRNDFCPSLRLSDRDLTCVRKDFSLEKYIPRMEKEGYVIKAEKLLWTDANSIYQRVREKCGKL